MQTKPKSNSIVTTRIPADAGTFEVTLTLPRMMEFDVLDVDTCALDLTKVHVANIAHACLHGMGQRVPDSAAIGTCDKDGNPIPKAQRSRMKHARMNEVCTHLESGSDQWRMKGDRAPEALPLGVEVFMRANDCSEENARERITAGAERGKRAFKAQLAIVCNLFPDECRDISAERASRITPAFDSDAEIENMKG